MPDFPQWPGHESVVIGTGARTGVPLVIAIHSSALGPAAGGCRVWRYPRWEDGLQDALRLSTFVLSGGDDFVLHVGLPDLDRLHVFLTDRIAKRREVTGFRTSVIFKQVHKAAPERLPD